MANSIITRTREHKLAALTSAIAIRLAASEHDPMYNKYKKYRQLYMIAKKKLIEKYGPRAATQARRVMSK